MRLDLSELFRSGIPLTNWKGTKVLTSGNIDFLIDTKNLMYELVKFPDELKDWIPDAKKNIILSQIKESIFNDLDSDKILRATVDSDISREAIGDLIRRRGGPLYIIYENKMFESRVIPDAKAVDVLYPY